MALADRVLVEFTRHEALVLWSFLSRCDNQGDALVFEDLAEQRMIWELELRIQPQIREVILDNPNYLQNLADARIAVRKAFEGSE